ncbi:N-succinylarginine dihydrolase [Poriferisphaera corsica]|uniref:N-succinylarginine dihydrolase n=1 Tax=Poriferisphaera corsica TaxID=2528020 RepID=A0A517YYZ6_9BACT|nr:N-succinylarginine dihydrolase [Poriferisphaera corsica]QDU35451.1 N-succinylarginine dihydrolase [Poriferisphaera corsica]
MSNSHPIIEASLEGLIGPTHNYAGLSPGNVASQSNKDLTSHPKTAALQALNKAKFLLDLGIPIIVCPPQPRPRTDILRTLGFLGTDKQIITEAHKSSPHLLAAIYSASAMWTANAATVTPSPDTTDQRAYFTPANLTSNFHRSLETAHTARILKQIFFNPDHFHHYPPLPSCPALSDEGAANHTRLCADYTSPGLHLFTYNTTTNPHHTQTGTSKLTISEGTDRQSLEASHAVARQHHLTPERTLFIQQNPKAVNAGVFHNDVIATGNRNLFLYHEAAYFNPDINQTITNAYQNLSNQPLHMLQISEELLPLNDAIASYFFNSQLISPKSAPHSQILIAPQEVKQTTTAHALVNQLLDDKILSSAHYLDVRQSMQNGGGPACLRLRVPLSDHQFNHLHTPAILTPALYQTLTNIITDHYPETLSPDDLADPSLLTSALNAITHIYNALYLSIS